MNDLPLAPLALLDSGQESTNTLHYVQTPELCVQSRLQTQFDQLFPFFQQADLVCVVELIDAGTMVIYD